MTGLAVLLLWLAPATAPEAVVPATLTAAPGAERARVLEMFARAYYPGRSGQIALVPRQGEFITPRGTEFMHGTERGLTLEQLRDAVQELPYVFAAFTEDELRRVVHC